METHYLQIQNVRPNLHRKVIPSGQYCVRDELVCRYLGSNADGICCLYIYNENGEPMLISNFEKVCIPKENTNELNTHITPEFVEKKY